MTGGNSRAAAILHLLAHAERPMTAVQLGRAVSASERTVKAEMAAARLLADGIGAAVRSRKGQGYWLEVIDGERYEPAIELLDIQAAFRGFDGDAARTRARLILGWLLFAEDYLKLDRFADEMYLSRTALRPDLRAVRTVLAGFGLDLESRPGSGIRVTGSEFDRRLCLTHLLESAFHRTVPTFADGVALLDPEEFAGLRQDLLRILRGSPVRVADIRTQRMAQYLTLSALRLRAGHRVATDPRWAALVQGRPQLDAARQVMTALAERAGVVVDAAEESALAVLLLMWTDVEAADEHLDRYGALGAAARRLTQAVHEDLLANFGVRLFEDEPAQLELAAGVVPLLARLEVGLGAAQMHFGVYTYLDAATSPVALAIARQVAATLSSDPPLATDAVVDLASRVTIVIDAVRHDFEPRRIALCSARGLGGAAHLRRALLDHYPAERYFATADTYELYELRGVPIDAYDAVVFDGVAVSYRYDWPVVCLERPPDPEGLRRFHEVVIQPGFHFDKVLASLGIERLATFGNVPAPSAGALAATIAFRLCDDREAAMAVEAALLRAFESSLFGRVCAIVLPRVAADGNRMELYEFASPLTHKGREITHVVLCSIDFRRDSVKCCGCWTNSPRLVRDPSAIEEAMRSGSIDSLTAAVAARAR
ncbi:MAG: helix-turn-helix domain-containing protein [Propionibacteriaceae bacterium]|nr:helix-turn-helix domain-containing protein [Propionibacteriaceae bacterium]